MKSNLKNKLIPVLKPYLNGGEIKAVTDVLKSGWWGAGKVTETLEKEFAKYVGAKYALAVNSCTSALHLAVKFYNKKTNISPNVITTPLTFPSTGIVGLYEGRKVLFRDIDYETLCLNKKTMTQAKFGECGIHIAVHYAGKVINYGNNNNIDIEDCAHASGSKLAGKQGRISCWSFHAVKNLGSSGGGMLTTNEERIYKYAKRLRWLGIEKNTYERMYDFDSFGYELYQVGYKYDTNDINSAIALVQLYNLDKMNTMRRKVANRYNNHLSKIKEILIPPESDTWHLYVIRILNGERNKFVKYMRESGICIGIHYKPLYHYPIFGNHDKNDFPVTEKVYSEICSIPIYAGMDDKTQKYIIDTIKKFFKQRGKI